LLFTVTVIVPSPPGGDGPIETSDRAASPGVYLVYLEGLIPAVLIREGVFYTFPLQDPARIEVGFIQNHFWP
jgi:hypothetical protein